MFSEQMNIVLQFSFFSIFSGSPTRPEVVSPAIGQHRYSYHLKWKSESQFPILQHRIEYWPKPVTVTPLSTANDSESEKDSSDSEAKGGVTEKVRRWVVCW